VLVLVLVIVIVLVLESLNFIDDDDEIFVRESTIATSES